MTAGRGILVLVVGPSGAGKDSLLRLAAAHFETDPRVVFPRRVITRPTEPTEDHDPASVEAFRRSERDGAFALSWTAHGLHYGIPAGIVTDLAASRLVICNVSRTIVTAARRDLQPVRVLEVTATPAILASRIEARGREHGAAAEARLERARTAIDVAADVVIHNDDRLHDAREALVEALSRWRLQLP